MCCWQLRSVLTLYILLEVLQKVFVSPVNLCNRVRKLQCPTSKFQELELGPVPGFLDKRHVTCLFFSGFDCLRNCFGIMIISLSPMSVIHSTNCQQSETLPGSHTLLERSINSSSF